MKARGVLVTNDGVFGNIIKVKPPTQVISLEAAKKSYDGFDGSTLAKRVAPRGYNMP